MADVATKEYVVTEGNFVTDPDSTLGLQKGAGEFVALTADQYKTLKAAKVVEPKDS